MEFQYAQLIGTFATVATTMLPFVWHLASKFQKMSGDITTAMAEVKVEITELKRQVQGLETSLKDQGAEVQNLRDNLTVVQTQISAHNLAELNDRLIRLETKSDS